MHDINVHFELCEANELFKCILRESGVFMFVQVGGPRENKLRYILLNKVLGLLVVTKKIKYVIINVRSYNKYTLYTCNQ